MGVLAAQTSHTSIIILLQILKLEMLGLMGATHGSCD